MNVLGITAEYDPLHNGHIYHLEKAREMSRADFVVVVMSGDFTQRGGPAILDKWTRARLAAENGADLVLELPFVYATASADYFAFGAMTLFNKLGCITHVAFGAETEDIDLLRKVARLTDDVGGKHDLAVERAVYEERLRALLDDGHSFATARGGAIEKALGQRAGEAAARPNNVLAIEYLKYCGDMVPVAVRRTVAHHIAPKETEKEALANFLPAGCLRASIEELLDVRRDPHVLSSKRRRALAELVSSLPVPNDTRAAILRERSHLGTAERLYPLLRQSLLLKSEEELTVVFGVAEGLEHRIKEALRYGASYEDFLDRLKTRRYPRTSIARALLHAMVSLPQWDIKNEAFTAGLYGRILAMSAKGPALLRQIKEEQCAAMPLLSNVGRGAETAEPYGRILRWDILAADLYNNAMGRDLYGESDFVRAPFVGEA